MKKVLHVVQYNQYMIDIKYALSYESNSCTMFSTYQYSWYWTKIARARPLRSKQYLKNYVSAQHRIFAQIVSRTTDVIISYFWFRVTTWYYVLWNFHTIPIVISIVFSFTSSVTTHLVLNHWTISILNEARGDVRFSNPSVTYIPSNQNVRSTIAPYSS